MIGEDVEVVWKVITVKYFDDCFFGKAFRVFFAFDLLCQAVMLCGGDNILDKQFYKTMILIAEREFLDYLTELE